MCSAGRAHSFRLTVPRALKDTAEMEAAALAFPARCRVGDAVYSSEAGNLINDGDLFVTLALVFHAVFCAHDDVAWLRSGPLCWRFFLI